ncbi:hypothetical protein D5086_033247 [Populus alba]|uniref:Uncharacterized protein n=1 Tax=Populus alba TaxID=43335 RepID=A0ACC4AG98_POPAL
MSDQNNTLHPPDVELKFQIQAMTKMMERMNFTMGNVCDRLEKVAKHGNMAGTCTQDVRKVGAELKSNHGSGAERLEWDDYEDFEEDVDDNGDGGFKDETIGYREVLERTESDLSKINWLHGVILLIPIVLVPWGRFPLCHTPIRPILAFRDQISILIVGCVTT